MITIMKTQEPVELLEDYCEFGDERVYLLMAIARKNENENITSSTEIVFREVIKHEKDIPRKVEKLRNAINNYGEATTFRLYASVNARNTVDTYWNFRERMNGWIKHYINDDDSAEDKLKRVDKNWKSELQRPGSRDETFFLWDLDEPEEEKKDFLVEKLAHQTEIKLVRQTPNGWHVITEAFDYTGLMDEAFEEMELERMNDRMFFLEKIID